MRIEIVRIGQEPGRIAEWLAAPEFSEVNAHPMTGGFGRIYYPAVYGEALVDATFTIVDRDRPLALVPCCVHDGILDNLGQPIQVFTARGADTAQAGKVVDEVIAELDRVGGRVGARETRIATSAEPSLGPLAAACLKSGFVASASFDAICDLSLDEAQLFGALRRRFRSFVNWGKTNLQMQYVNKSTARREVFDNYQQFHLKVAGRSTRTQASWDRMYEWIVSGGGELALGHLADSSELVAGTMIVDGSETAYYASGVYDRDRFDKPIAHWPMFDAVLRARGRGLKRFDVGSLPQPGSASAKEEQIGYFKRGFATSTKAKFVWRRDRATTE